MIKRFVSWLQEKADTGNWYAVCCWRSPGVSWPWSSSTARWHRGADAGRLHPAGHSLDVLILDDSQLAEEMIRRLGLTGASVELVTLLFDDDLVPDQSSGIGSLSLFFVLLSLYLFGKRVRHLYERAYDLPSSSAKSEWRSVWWVMLLAAYFIGISGLRNWSIDYGKGVQPGDTDAYLDIVALFFFTWWTPRFLAGHAGVSWRHALSGSCWSRARSKTSGRTASRTVRAFPV